MHDTHDAHKWKQKQTNLSTRQSVVHYVNVYKNYAQNVNNVSKISTTRNVEKICENLSQKSLNASKIAESKVQTNY